MQDSMKLMGKKTNIKCNRAKTHSFDHSVIHLEFAVPGTGT